MARQMTPSTVSEYLQYLNELIYKDPTVEITVMEVIDALSNMQVQERSIVIDGDGFRKYFSKPQKD
jgi:hypothetical protein